MAIRKFIEELGEKILPVRRQSLPVAQPQHAIRSYLQTRREFDAPSDLVVVFNEMDAVVILGGTVRDETTREAIVQAAGNINGVERVDDRMVPSPRPTWSR